MLTAPRIAGLETQVRAYAQQLVEDGVAHGGFDAATQFGQLIPTITMCALMDLPVSERDKFLRWNMATLAGADFTSPEALQAYGEMAAYWTGLVEERKATPGNDLISQILHTEVKGEDLSSEEVAGFCSLLHDAAQNTTMNMITHGAVTLANYPDERRKLRANRALWPQALEEILRFVSPVQGLARATTCGVEIHGVSIPAGEQVLLLYGSANHDERVFENPETLNLDRPVRANYTFGHGIHHCLGSAVAKLEVRVALDVMLDLVGDWSADNDKIERNRLVPTPRGSNSTRCVRMT